MKAGWLGNKEMAGRGKHLHMTSVGTIPDIVKPCNLESPPAKGEYPKGEGFSPNRVRVNHPALRAPLLGRRGVGEATGGSSNFEPEILLVSQTRPREPV